MLLAQIGFASTVHTSVSLQDNHSPPRTPSVLHVQDLEVPPFPYRPALDDRPGGEDGNSVAQAGVLPRVLPSRATPGSNGACVLQDCVLCGPSPIGYPFSCQFPWAHILNELLSHTLYYNFKRPSVCFPHHGTQPTLGPISAMGESKNPSLNTNSEKKRKETGYDLSHPHCSQPVSRF